MCGAAARQGPSRVSDLSGLTGYPRPPCTLPINPLGLPSFHPASSHQDGNPVKLHATLINSKFAAVAGEQKAGDRFSQTVGRWAHPFPIIRPLAMSSRPPCRPSPLLMPEGTFPSPFPHMAWQGSMMVLSLVFPRIRAWDSSPSTRSITQGCHPFGTALVPANHALPLPNPVKGVCCSNASIASSGSPWIPIVAGPDALDVLSRITRSSRTMPAGATHLLLPQCSRSMRMQTSACTR